MKITRKKLADYANWIREAGAGEHVADDDKILALLNLIEKQSEALRDLVENYGCESGRAAREANAYAALLPETDEGE